MGEEHTLFDSISFVLVGILLLVMSWLLKSFGAIDDLTTGIMVGVGAICHVIGFRLTLQHGKTVGGIIIFWFFIYWSMECVLLLLHHFLHIGVFTATAVDVLQPIADALSVVLHYFNLFIGIMIFLLHSHYKEKEHKHLLWILRGLGATMLVLFFGKLGEWNVWVARTFVIGLGAGVIPTLLLQLELPNPFVRSRSESTRLRETQGKKGA